MKSSTQKGSVEYINPEGMHSHPAYTQMVVVSGATKTLHIGMQNAVDASGAVVGRGDIAKQTEQILKNIDFCLEAGGAKREHLILMRIYITEGQDIRPGFEVFQRWWGRNANPPANTVIFVSQTVPADYLVGIEAVAVVPL